MDRLLSRAAYYHARAVLKSRRKAAAAARLTLSKARKEHTEFRRLVSADIRASRAEEKASLVLGPAAPKVAVGKKEIELLGAMDQLRVIPPKIPQESGKRLGLWNIVKGDRVVVLAGPDRHKIGTVTAVDKESNRVTVEGANKVPIKTPSMFLSVDPNTPAVMWREQPIHVSQVRLVHAIRDPVTNVFTDHIVANVTRSPLMKDKMTGKLHWTRYVAGTNIVIPWPEEVEPDHVDHPVDTRIMTVETASFIPTLLKAPMPLEVIDELRAKYSKFRTRFSKEFKERLDEKERVEKERIETLKKMARTPLQDAHRRDREEKKKLGPPVMSDEVAEMIGKVMAQNRPELLKKLEAKA
ncbi:hypothetical protein EX30DRAFT_393904 [Ascodesmis nigricans]|uniref:KOW domain-containing protein n=1 Tax=Ascodesmis nigricans TaxID=341454 RepID=A0A4S2N554_9PEZI|nr:hypothetical protein EX30DRAFT_393904 [Ascodesmis nigricans]